MNYLHYTQRTPIQPTTTTSGLTTAAQMTPYVPPHCRQTPPHMSTPVRQQPTPASSIDPFRDDGTTPHPSHTSFYQNLQNTPTPTIRHDKRSLSLAYDAVQHSQLYSNDENGRQQYTKDITTWEQVWGKNEQMSFTKNYLPLTPGTVLLGS
jgi:hypothetical protein